MTWPGLHSSGTDGGEVRTETLWYGAYTTVPLTSGSRGPSGIIGRICPPVRGGKLCASVQSGDGLSTGSGPAEAAQPLAGPSHLPQRP